MIRRGQPAVQIVHGISATLSCCELLHFKLLNKIDQLSHPDALKYLIEAGLVGYKGQAVDVHLINLHKCPTLSEYLQLACAKASTYFILAYRLMKLFSTSDVDLKEFVMLFGNCSEKR